jgi:hypothetical protein
MLLDKILVMIIAVAVLSSILIGCNPTAKALVIQKHPAGTQAFATSPARNEQPIAQEVNPTGDTSDNQVFVTYSSTSGCYQPWR